MSLDALFSIANMIAMAGWIVLLASPLLPSWTLTVPRIAIPALLGVAYVGLVLVGWTRAEGGYGSLDDVALLFQSRTMLSAGWLHYLAFDLFVGSWITVQARAAGMAFWLVVPCLVLTFLFGPTGFVLYLALRAATGSRTIPSETRP